MIATEEFRCTPPPLATSWSPEISFILCEPGPPEETECAIASLRAQAFRDFECIVIAYFGSGISAEALSSATEGDPRFRLVRFQGPASIGAARNTGLRLARGRYVTLVQDRYLPADLQRQLSQLDISQYAGLHASKRARHEHSGFYTSNDLAGLRLGRAILRLSAARAVGGFIETDDFDGETQFFQRLLDAGYTLACYRTALQPDVLVSSDRQPGVSIGTTSIRSPFPDAAFSHLRLDRYRCDSRKDLPVLFVPHKDYHLWTIGLLAPRLRALGIDFLTLDLTPQWGEAGVRAGADNHDVELLGLGEFVLGRFTPRLMVTFNDWDYISRPLILAARAAGLPTLGIVEGIQDYDDVDTAAERKAYRLVENVILPGVFDYKYFATCSGQRVFVAGVPRIQIMRTQREQLLSPAMRSRVLINSNFSYGVLTQHRDAWLKAAVSAVRTAGYEPVISRHPADKGHLFPELISTGSFYETLQTCCGSVQRFASGVLEAIAYNKPVFYFNVHNEKVDKFTLDPMGVYPVSHSETELIADLHDLPVWQQRTEENGPAFLDLHAGKRTLDIVGKMSGIIAALGAIPISAEAADKFHAYLRAVDELTDALCAPDTGSHAPFFNLAGAIERLQTAAMRQRNEMAE